MSANDLGDMGFEQPNLVGGLFKTLPRFGFRHTDERVKTVAKRKHARRVDCWVLEDRAKAKRLVQPIRRFLTGKTDDPQLKLW